MVRPVLVTGAGGFLGRSVTRHLSACGYQVVSLGRFRRDAGSHHVPLAFPVNAGDCADALTKLQPMAMIHLASAAPGEPQEEHTQITEGFALALFDAAATAIPDARIVTIGSAAELGAAIRPDRAMVEEDICQPLSAYGAAKHAVTRYVEECWKQGRDIAVLRLFGAVGPDMPPHTVFGGAARQIKALGAGSSASIVLGSLDVERDYLDADEAARLIVALAMQQKGLPPVLNICSGHAFHVGAIINRMVQLSNKACGIAQVSRPEDRQSPKKVTGSTAKLAALGYFPLVPDEEALAKRALGIA
jgi:GDP-4-dehydro-6-deoxy-D-mannose reductase